MEKEKGRMLEREKKLLAEIENLKISQVCANGGSSTEQPLDPYYMVSSALDTASSKQKELGSTQPLNNCYKVKQPT